MTSLQNMTRKEKAHWGDDAIARANKLAREIDSCRQAVVDALFAGKKAGRKQKDFEAASARQAKAMEEVKTELSTAPEPRVRGLSVADGIHESVAKSVEAWRKQFETIREHLATRDKS